MGMLMWPCWREPHPTFVGLRPHPAFEIPETIQPCFGI